MGRAGKLRPHAQQDTQCNYGGHLSSSLQDRLEMPFILTHKMKERRWLKIGETVIMTPINHC